MKILITENKVKNVLKQTGVGKTIKLLGGWDNFCEVLNIETPMDFLHLFDDLEQVKSEKKENWTLFRYKKGENLMIYDRKNEIVYINNYEIWLFIEDKFGLSYYETQRITQDWLDEVYNLRGVTTTVSKTISGGSWMRSTI
jgi:hypothetical protein